MVRQAYDEEWRRKHLCTIGASNAAATIAKARFKSRSQLWHDMHDLIHDNVVPPALKESDDLRRGNMLEPIARELLAERLGISIDPHDQMDFRTRSEYPFAHALPDGWIGLQPVELKVPRPLTIINVNLRGMFDEWTLQAQHTMAVCDSTCLHFAMLDPVSCVIHYTRIERDDALIESLMAAEAEFYRTVLDKKRPPEDPPLEPDDRGGHAPLILDSEDAVKAATVFAKLKLLVGDAAETMDQMKAKLRELADGRSRFVVPGVLKVTDTVGKPRRTFQKDIALRDFPKLEGDKYWKFGKASRTFRPTVLMEP